MKMYLLSDNVDTQRGMRLAGIDGTLVHEREETEKALLSVCADKEIGVLLITEKLALNFADIFESVKLSAKTPLIVEIPDRHGSSGSSLLDYVKEVVGI